MGVISEINSGEGRGAGVLSGVGVVCELKMGRWVRGQVNQRNRC